MAECGEKTARHFEPPPNCPVFTPTIEEFADPLGYIAKIRPRAEPYGICKVRPPPGWEPPFCVNFETLKFTPRVQRINELEAHTRIKINFLDRLAKFWELQGSVLQVPTVERKTLDLYKFFEMVRSKGGYEAVETAHLWDHFARTLVGDKVAGEEVKAHYKRILYPFELFEDGKCLNHLKLKNPHRGRKRRAQTNVNLLFDPLAKYVCQKCSRGDGEDQMLLCDGCDESWHTFCLMPPLTDIPPGDWRCPKCVLVEVRKPTEDFGFEQASREYTLPAFGRMADDFKVNYFGRPLPAISVDDVEQEFWKIVGNVDADVSVEYGADLHSMEHGSGFPTKSNESAEGTDWRHSFYRDSPWNLNNLPVLQGSLLSYINSDISGMMVPWMYVGMCFSTFCWHNEDHWSYSVNYLHWGEPKTWYGVPGDKAHQFESVMKCHAPELFENQPDLLHQLVTIMNPNILTKAGVPIYRCMQYPGDFVITFPRAYHAGFNQGYNFAEAVNFCPPDWLPKGRQCMIHYSTVKRFCVFSQDELVCKMAGEMRDAPVSVTVALLEDLCRLRNTEIHERQRMLSLGCKKARRELFELLSDDIRQCGYCKTTLYLSAISCPCSNRYSCLRHHQDMCGCPVAGKLFCYRYTLDEMSKMVEDLKRKTIPFQEWLSDVADCMLRTSMETGKPQNQEILSLVTRGEQLQFRRSELFSQLKAAADECDRYSRVACRVLHLNVEEEEDCKKPVDSKEAPRCAKPHVHVDDAADGDCCPHSRVTLSDMQMFVKAVEALPGMIPEYGLLKETIADAEEMSGRVLELMNGSESPQVTIPAFLEEARHLVVYVEGVDKLELKYECSLWNEKVERLLNNPAETTIELVDGIVKEFQLEYAKLGGADMHSKLCNIRKTLTDLEATAETLLAAKPQIPFNDLEAFVKSAKRYPLVKHFKELSDIHSLAMDWMRGLANRLAAPTLPLMQDIEPLFPELSRIGVDIPHLSTLEGHLVFPKKWILRVERVFLPKKGRTLLDVFLPFVDVKNEFDSFGKRRDNTMEAVLSRHGVSKADFSSTQQLHEACEVVAEREILQMHQLRLANLANPQLQCVCSNPTVQRPNVVRCELCKALYHSVCCEKPTSVPPTPRSRPNPNRNTTYRALCPRCDRGERVGVEDIINLVNILEKSRVRTIEGEAFQFFAHRIVEWKKNAQEALEKPEHIFTLVKLPASEEGLEVDPSEEAGSGAPVGSPDGADDPRKKHPRKSTHTVLRDLDLSKNRDKVVACYEWLLMEGLLLNATLAEVDDIWTLLQVVRKDHAVHVVPDPSEVEKEKDEFGTVDNPRPRAPPSPMVRSLDTPGPSRSPAMSTSGAAGSSPKCPRTEEARLSSSKEDSSDASDSEDSDSDSDSGSEAGSVSRNNSDSDQHSDNDRRSSSDESDSDSPDSDKNEEKHEQPVKKKGRPRKNAAASTDDDACSANPCKFNEVPIGGELQWVQCDSCEAWYHFFCVGLKKLSDVQSKSYLCPRCLRGEKAPVPRGRPLGSKNEKKRETQSKLKLSPSAKVVPKARAGVKPKSKATLKPKVK